MINRIGRRFNKKRILTIVLVFLVFVMSLGYATLQEHMDIDGVATIDRNWIVKISSVNCTKTGSASIVSSNYISNTFTINAIVPSSSTIMCTVTIVNQGNVKAKLNSIDVTSENKDAASYTVSGVTAGSTTLGINGTNTATIKLTAGSASITDRNVRYMFTFNYIEDAPSSGSNNKDGTSFSTGSYATFVAGEIVKTVDNNTWYVTKDSGAAEEYVTLVSMMPLTSSGDFAKCEFGVYECGYKRAFDTSGSSDYNKFSSTNVGYFLENTFLPKIRSSLSSSGGNTTGLTTRLLTSDEVYLIENFTLNKHIYLRSFENGTSLSSLSYYSRWFMDKSDTDNTKVKCSVGFTAFTMLHSDTGQALNWNESTKITSPTGGGSKICSPVEQNTVVPVIVTKKINVKTYLNMAILADNNLLKSTNPTNGLYYTTGPVVTSYFRGQVNNNFVKFAGLYWRILRVNNEGSVRMIYQGTTANATGTNAQISSEKYNVTSSNSNAYVGYMYGSTLASASYYDTHNNVTPSNIKNYLDNWYTSKLSAFSSYLVADSSSTGFCNNRTVGNRGTGAGNYWPTTYEDYTNLWDKKTLTLSCPNNDLFTMTGSYSGNKKLTKPIGLISAAEVNIAGGVWGTSNTNFFLYTGSGYWTMTPAMFNTRSSIGDAIVLIVTENGAIDYRMVSLASGVRPVINIKAGTYIKGGIGTANDPYVIA